MAGNRKGAGSKEAPAKAAGDGSPAKSSSPNRAKLTKGRRSYEELRKSKPRSPAWYLEGRLFDGNLAGFTTTMADPNQDCYAQPLIEALADTESDAEICNTGIIGAFYMKVSLTDERPLTNVKDDYMRKTFVILMEPEEMTREGLYAKLLVVKKFFELPTSNAYKTKVVIPKEWDKTPPEPTPLPKLDEVLQYKEVKKVLSRIYNKADMTWYGANEEEAWCFFNEGHVPFEAVLDLGFPEDRVCAAAPHVTNDPLE